MKNCDLILSLRYSEKDEFHVLYIHEKGDVPEELKIDEGAVAVVRLETERGRGDLQFELKERLDQITKKLIDGAF